MMKTPRVPRRPRDGAASLRLVADQAFSRAAGAPLVAGNRVRPLRNAEENYPAWLDAIRSAERAIHFESYILHEDDAGREFAEALAAKARQGVRVRLLYDWLGALSKTSRRFWRSLARAGVDVRAFNPPRLDSPLGWVSRDHRKMLAVDGRVAFVTGLCVGRMWVGDPARGIEPWRDTGVEVRGPAVADIERAFAEIWAASGEPLPGEEVPHEDAIPPAGDAMLRIVATTPHTAGLYRLDQLVAAIARESLWLADAYFVGITPYVQALRAAALDGVDVRLLVPGGSDIALISPLSRAGYRPLLEAGIRVFEWNGPMMHAKTAVADGRWARVGSTNLNIASWLGNYELDVVVENQPFARAMEQMFLDDLAGATEIVLGGRRRIGSPGRRRRRPVGARGSGGSVSRAAAGAIRIGNAVGAAITNRRVLGAAEARVMFMAGLLLLLPAVVAALWPRLIAIPLAGIGLWLSASLLLRGYRLWREGKREAAGEEPPQAAPAPPASEKRSAGSGRG